MKPTDATNEETILSKIVASFSPPSQLSKSVFDSSISRFSKRQPYFLLLAWSALCPDSHMDRSLAFFLQICVQEHITIHAFPDRTVKYQPAPLHHPPPPCSSTCFVFLFSTHRPQMYYVFIELCV